MLFSVHFFDVVGFTVTGTTNFDTFLKKCRRNMDFGAVNM